MKFGQGLVEYALLIALIAIVVLLIIVLLGPTVQGFFERLISNTTWTL